MFDLEHEISAWRARFAADLHADSEIIDELETQLRDSVEGLVRSGMGLPDAWRASVEQLGQQKILVEQLRAARAGHLPSSWAIRGILVLCGLAFVFVLILLGQGFISGAYSLTVLIGGPFLAVGQLALLAAGMAGAVDLARGVVRGRTGSGFEDIRVCGLLRNLNLLGLIGLSTALVFHMGALHLLNESLWNALRSAEGTAWVWVSMLVAHVSTLGAIERRELHTALAASSFAAAAMGLLAGGVTSVVPIGWLMLAVLLKELALYRLRSSEVVPVSDSIRSL